MPRQPKTKSIGPPDVLAYLAQAEEYLASAEDNLKLERFNAAASAAIHAGINAADAICGAVLGERSTSADHSAVIDLVSQAEPMERKSRRNLAAFFH